MTASTYITFSKHGHVAVIALDCPNRKVNILDEQSLRELTDAVEQVHQDNDIKTAVIISGKKDNFLAGADINALATLTSAHQAEQICLDAQELFLSIARSKKTFVAAINGSCFGGGLELALSCQFRIASRDTKTSFAFPEVALGLLPAASGTQMLPRLIGLKPALEMLLLGRKKSAQEARDMGLVDAVVNRPEELYQAALTFAQMAHKKKPKKLKSPSAWWFLPLFVAKRRVMKKTHGLFPAPLAIVDIIKMGVIGGLSAGLKEEARQFGELSQTKESKNLVRLFLLKKDREKNPFDKPVPPVSEVGIVGSGLMGSGIAQVSILGDVMVHLSDKKQEALSEAQAAITKNLKKMVKRNKLTNLECTRKLSKLFVESDGARFNRSDVVIEAIVEDLGAKKKLLKEIENQLKPDALFATNTSSIPIAEIAQESAMKDRIVGMHYFSPVDKVPLLEIVRSKFVSDETLARACDLGLRQKRTIIIVNDRAGFYTTRVIATLFDEACILLLEGHAPSKIDQELTKLGFPTGPIALMDEVGLDVGLHVSKTLFEHFGSRLIAADLRLSEKMVENNFLGRKSGKGFYSYNHRRQGFNQNVRTIIASLNGNTVDSNKKNRLGERMLLRVVNEASYCLSENVVSNVDDADTGAVFGIGFPPNLGGPFAYINQVGKQEIATMLDRFKRDYGKRFAKSPFFDRG